MEMKQIIIKAIILLWVGINVNSNAINAQKIIAEPREITAGEGEVFQITYRLEDLSINDFVQPNFGKLKLVSGPNQSNSVQIINGQITRSASVSYGLVGSQIGSYSIEPAQAKINNKTYNSQKINVSIVKGRTQKPSTQNPSQNPFQNFPFSFPQHPSPNAQVPNPSQNNPLFSPDDAFRFEAVIPTNELYVGQQLIVTYRLYSKAQVTDYDMHENPTFNGFLVQDISPNQANPRIENINGQEWYVIDLRKYLLFPQIEGKLTIDPMAITINYQVPGTSGGLFNFFRTQNHQIAAKTRDIKVKPLPEEGKPKDFSGAVGNFSLSSKADRSQITTDENINITLSLNGSGNFDLLSPPIFTNDVNWNVYDPTIQESTQVVKDSLQGSIKYSYAVLPKREGQQLIPAIQYNYFDPTSKSYKSIATSPIPISITRGSMLSDNGPTASAQINDIITKPTLAWVNIIPWNSLLSISYMVSLIAMVFLFLKIKKNREIQALEKANHKTSKPLENYMSPARYSKPSITHREIKQGLQNFIQEHLYNGSPQADISSILTDTSIPTDWISDYHTMMKACDQALYMHKEIESPTTTAAKAEKWIERVYSYINKQ